MRDERPSSPRTARAARSRGTRRICAARARCSSTAPASTRCSWITPMRLRRRAKSPSASTFSSAASTSSAWRLPSIRASTASVNGPSHRRHGFWVTDRRRFISHGHHRFISHGLRIRQSRTTRTPRSRTNANGAPAIPQSKARFWNLTYTGRAPAAGRCWRVRRGDRKPMRPVWSACDLRAAHAPSRASRGATREFRSYRVESKRSVESVTRIVRAVVTVSQSAKSVTAFPVREIRDSVSPRTP